MLKGVKAKAVKATIKEALSSISSLNQDQVISRRWTGHLNETADYYSDDEIKNVSKKLTEFPPNQLDLSDAWVVAIVNFKLSREDRGSS